MAWNTPELTCFVVLDVIINRECSDCWQTCALQPSRHSLVHSRFRCFDSCHSAPVIMVLEDFSGKNHQFLTPMSRRAKRSIVSLIPRPTGTTSPGNRQTKHNDRHSLWWIRRSPELSNLSITSAQRHTTITALPARRTHKGFHGTGHRTRW